jgi:OOP family OmpA-OmpF porin
MKPILTPILVALLLAGSAASAQKSPMKATDVTESAITDALAPAPDAEARSRGFTPAQRPVAKKPASAAVLITFVTASSDLTAESRSALDVIAHAMAGDRLKKLNFVVEGHADQRGDADRNVELSKERAESVIAYLVDQHGIERTRLVAIGKGSTEPLNKTVVDAPENRRVTFVTSN